MYNIDFLTVAKNTVKILSPMYEIAEMSTRIKIFNHILKFVNNTLNLRNVRNNIHNKK